jgi:phosphotransferase system HPr (HPr) family protein
MKSITRSTTVTVTNSQGLHARPADMLVRLATQFNADIELEKDGERVDGKSILSVMTLGAEQGTQLAIRAIGPDAEEAVRALARLIVSGFAENGEQSSRNAVD